MNNSNKWLLLNVQYLLMRNDLYTFYFNLDIGHKYFFLRMHECMLKNIEMFIDLSKKKYI